MRCREDTDDSRAARLELQQGTRRDLVPERESVQVPVQVSAQALVRDRAQAPPIRPKRKLKSARYRKLP